MSLLYRDLNTRDTELMGALAKVYGTAGICYDVKLSSDELAVLRGVVTESWLNAPSARSPPTRSSSSGNSALTTTITFHTCSITRGSGRRIRVRSPPSRSMSFARLTCEDQFRERFQRQRTDPLPYRPMAISAGRGSIGVWCGPATAPISDRSMPTIGSMRCSTAGATSPALSCG